ncbi:tissue factor pathway inhibitor a isoform X2 [Gouania willdenowi]|uniref:Tissue factor pathway inhibitor n=1 Tax=Gouania willdenowi TaxID=441366 RepID=A0A8C5H5T9_GOUWI|nr:tissue factor pathway inhibitor-like isoform X2 [Gouania willdenowi]
MRGIVCAVVLACLLRVGCSWRDGAAANVPQHQLFIFNELCALKDEPGPCKAIKDRFFFDVDTGRCQMFEYGGCGGNANNFKSLEECEEMCVVSDDKDPCHLSEAPGPCRGLVSRFFFDSKSQQCKHFFYGGCFGNANNFRSLAECHARCHRPAKPTEAPEVQTQSAERVPTTPTTIATGEHLLLLNQSNVWTKDFVPSEFCFSPVDGGDDTCKRDEKRFAFNASTKRCVAFSYSGCGGNNNNFRLRKHCIHRCIKGKKGHVRKTMIRLRKKNLESIARRSL